MINNNELEAIKLSPTAKDFYQIWNELLDTANKLSSRWSPTETNESDPGIVLLKLLTAVADKLNYTIDKNILEAFLPSATQEESMRKLCEMLGYSMKYYQSATTDVTVSYTGAENLIEHAIYIPKGTYITDLDDSVSYFTLEPITLADDITVKTVQAMEGELVPANPTKTNIVTLDNLDENNRYYFPEVQIAENGIFVYNINDGEAVVTDTSVEWIPVNNLNTQVIGTPCYKFGIDSKRMAPYIQFPDDISAMIKDGLFIQYTRTHGIVGNVNVGTLKKFQNEADILIKDTDNTLKPIKDLDEDSQELFDGKVVVKNTATTFSGKDKESLDDAYNNYKKTIGTFDTLVTCRDYMNKIYQLTYGDLFDNRDTTPAVSNVIVSDIRSDINRAAVICGFGEYGMKYSTVAKTDNGSPLISNFDLILYPFKTVRGLNTELEFLNSFTYDNSRNVYIEDALEKYKTISHIYKQPNLDDILCIINHLGIRLSISTIYKVTATEESEIIRNAYTAIYKNFNMRKLDFGEQIPKEQIIKVVKESDRRIKAVEQYGEAILSTEVRRVGDTAENTAHQEDDIIQLIANNVLAGNIELFDYNLDFTNKFNESDKQMFDNVTKIEASTKVLDKEISSPKTLTENQVVIFSAPNYKTDKTYTSYTTVHLEGFSNPTDLEGKIIMLTNDQKVIMKYTKKDENGESKLETDKYEAGQLVRINIANATIQKIAKNCEGMSSSSYKTYEDSTDKYYILGTQDSLETLEESNVTFEVGDSGYFFLLLNNGQTSIPAGSTYTLQENEYLFYTDKNKQDFIYYGYGTKLKLTGIELSTNNIETSATLDEILEFGLDVINGWQFIRFENNQQIKVIEQQYRVLTKGDTILKYKSDDVNNTKFKYMNDPDGTENTLPSLPGTAKWEAKAILELNVGPDKVQTVNTDDEIKVTSGTSAPVTIAPGSAFKTNYSIFNSGRSGQAINLSGLDIKGKELVLKSDETNEIPIQWNNFLDNWTKIIFPSNAEINTKTLYINIPENNIGLLMIHRNNIDINCNTYVKLYGTDEEEIKTLSTIDGTEYSYVDGEGFALNNGINILKLDSNVKRLQLIGKNKTAGMNCTDAIILGDLDVVRLDTATENPNLNPKLGLTSDDYTKLISLIKSIDKTNQFYYNAIIDNSRKINIDDYEEETLRSPYAYYDKNNINNKFVVTQVRAEIILDKTSKLNKH